MAPPESAPGTSGAGGKRPDRQPVAANTRRALRVNAKEQDGRAHHPDRDPQFRSIAAQHQAFAAVGGPLIRVDTKQKALIGDFKNAGQAWCQPPDEVNVPEFLPAALGRAAPDGSFDPPRHEGAVSGGTAADTAEFAVTASAHWWADRGRLVYPRARDLLILADAGGSHGCRPRLWNAQLPRQLSDRLGLSVTVCHDPTGCSKWHPLEQRLCSQISLNWAGKPLRTFETLLGYSRDTTTTTGLRVTGSLLEGVYQTGQRGANAAMKTLQVAPPVVCPRWNSTIRPRVDSALAP